MKDYWRSDEKHDFGKNVLNSVIYSVYITCIILKHSVSC